MHENHQKQRLTPEAFGAQIAYLTSEREEFLGRIEKRAPTTAAKWTAPPPEIIMINVDAAFQTATSSGGWCLVARDGTGDVVIAAAGKLVNMASALQAEAEAMLKAIRMAESYGMGRVYFETDCINLQQAISSSSQYRGPLGVLFREARFLLHISFIEHKIMYCPRACNLPAHLLAAFGSNAESESQQVWHADLPDDVTRVVTANLVGLLYFGKQGVPD